MLRLLLLFDVLLRPITYAKLHLLHETASFALFAIHSSLSSPNDMIQRCQRLIGGLLAFLVLLCLHLIHSTTLILALILHLIHHFRLSLHGSGSHSSDDTTTTTSTYATTRRRFGLKEEDITLWKAKKVPKCLGIIFVPPARGYFSLRHLKYKAYENESVYLGMQDDAIRLVGWAVELGIEELLLYDENGEYTLHLLSVSATIRKADLLSCF